MDSFVCVLKRITKEIAVETEVTGWVGMSVFKGATRAEQVFDSRADRVQCCQL